MCVFLQLLENFMDNANDIVELQQQVAFQEQTIDALNEVVSRQQQDLTRLDRALALLAQQMASMQQAADAGPGHVRDKTPVLVSSSFSIITFDDFHIFIFFCTLH